MILIGCEYSGRVRDAFISRGFDAMSCDILPTEHPGPHHHGDIREILQRGGELLIAFPDCTYLCSSGLHWNGKRHGRERKTEEALDFVRLLMDAPFDRIAIENPVGRIGTAIRQADQIIHPYFFGDDASKQTCLWLKNLPHLQPTNIIPPCRWACCGQWLDVELFGKYGCPICCGDNEPLPRWGNQTPRGQDKTSPSETRGLERAKTFMGIANAMADQWGSALSTFPIQKELF